MEATLLKLTGLDWLYIVLMVIAIGIGFWRGFLREVMALLVWVIAAILAVWLSPIIGNSIQASVPSAMGQIGVGFLAGLIIAYIGGMILRYLFLKLIPCEPSVGSRFLGGVCGFIKGLIWLSVLTFLLAFTTLSEGTAWQKSILIPEIISIDQAAIHWMPENSRDTLKNLFSPLTNNLDESIAHALSNPSASLDNPADAF